MSSSNVSSSALSSKSVIEKAISHAKKLRNKMNEFIVTDPFYPDVFDVKHDNSLVSVDGSSKSIWSQRKYEDLSAEDREKIHIYLKGDSMLKDEEWQTMKLLKSLSAIDLCKATEEAYSSSHKICICSTCKAYDEENLCCDIKRTTDRTVSMSDRDEQVNGFINEVKEKYRSNYSAILKYVDCIKICVHSLYLNDSALQKIFSQCKEKGHRLPSSVHTFFVEYKIPDLLTRKSAKSKCKTDSGLNDSDFTRICSRKLQDGAIYYKHTSVHNIYNLEKFCLEDIEVTFHISCRIPRQKHINALGCAVFNCGLIEVSNNLTCNRELVVKLKESIPVVIGTIRVSFQLGCGKLYFGKDFIDALHANKESCVPLCRDEVSISDSEKILNRERERKSNNKRAVIDANSRQPERHNFQSGDTTPSSKQSHKHVSYRSAEVQTEEIATNIKNTYSLIHENENQLLFGFLYISEAQYLTKPLNSYIVCRLFGQHEVSESRLIENTSIPVFNFCQVIPLIYEDSLLEILQNNFMVIEIFEKLNSRDLVIGIVKISLHQFYLAYKNPVVFKYLKKNKLPVIGTDWWEPIVIPSTQEIVGQIQILAALGTEEQIQNLEYERGFKKYNVRVNPINHLRSCGIYPRSIENFQPVVDQELHNYNIEDEKLHMKKKVPNNTQTKGDNQRTQEQIEVKKLDIGVQSNLMMDEKDSEKKAPPSAQDMLDFFLNKLVAHKPTNICVENSTNTDDLLEFDPKDNVDALENVSSSHKVAQDATNQELRKTSELLDSLQEALAIDSVPKKRNNVTKSNTFRVSIKIENALHLPSRKKCKSKKSKNRGGKWEDILPSTYVTFETTPGSEIQVTKICQKSANPCWNFEGHFDLPLELLINNQKRLIFKIWRKSTNTIMQPQMQTDVVLGFAALDLSVLITGLPSIKGWYNIVDFSGKVNGQINISVTPFANLTKYQSIKETSSCEYEHHLGDTENSNVSNCSAATIPENSPIDEPGELLSRALKRKFSELDEITQRLRLRLSKVTNDESDISNDELTEEFERDINTLCVEDDFDMVNFEEGQGNSKSLDQSGFSHTKKSPLEIDTSNTNDGGTMSDGGTSLLSIDTTEMCFNSNDMPHQNALKTNVENIRTLDKDLRQGKLHIDALLEKLSALQASESSSSGTDKQQIDNTAAEKMNMSSANVSTIFSSRYVSGCSANTDENISRIDTEAILQALDRNSRPNIQSCSRYDPLVFQQIYGADSNESDTCSNKSSSETSIFTNNSRVAPDGAGASTEDKVNVPADT